MLPAAPPPPSSDSRVLCTEAGAMSTLGRERPPAPSYGGAAGRQCSRLPSDFQKDSVTLFVSSGLCLWELLEPGALVMSVCSHYLFLHCINSRQALQCGARGSSPEHGLSSLPLCLSCSSHPPSNSFQLGISAAFWSLERSGTSGTVFLFCFVFLRGAKKSCCTLLGQPGPWQGPLDHTL